MLEDHGFDDVHPLIGGFDAWQEAGLPVEPRRQKATGQGI